MEFKVKIQELQDCDLPRYKEHLLDLIIQVQTTQAFRSVVMDRIDEVEKEIKRREECGPKPKILLLQRSELRSRSS